MKEISLSRILRWTLASFIVSFFIALIFNVGIASAEIGNITISNSLNFLGYTPGAGGALGDTFMWDTFNFDITDYNTVSSFYVITDTNTVYKLVSNSTYFTCNTGCVGSGFASYNKLGKIIDWEFAPGFTVTAHPFNLTYETNIFDSNNFDMQPATESGNNGAMTSAHPMFIRTAGARQAEKLKDTVTAIASDNVVIGTSTTNFYNFTYPISNNFQGKITKQNIATRIKVESQTGSYFDEGATSLNNITMGAILTNGIYLNVSLALGNYTKLLINSTGVSGIPAPTNTPVVNPVTGKGISFDRNTYTIGDTANISWAISNSIWNAFSTQTVVLKKVGLDDTTSISNVAPQNGNSLWLWTSCANPATQSVLCGYGTYQAIIYTNLLGLFETNRETAEAQVFPTQDSYILINSSVPIKTSTNVTAFIGVGGVGSNGMLATYFFDPKSNDYIGESQVIGLQSGLNYRNLTFKQIGKYRVVLKNIATNQEYAAKLVDTYHTQISAPYNFTTSNITLTQTSFTFNDVMVGNYKVDSVNYSTGFPTYIDIYNLDTNSITAEFYGTGQTWDDTSKQLGNVLIRIENLPQISGFPETKWIAGNNLIRLMLNNSVAGNSTVLSFVQFSLSTINSDGYGLTVNKNKILSGESVIVTITIPPGTTANLTLVDPNNKVSSRKIIRSISFTDTLKVVGQYEYQLMNANNSIEMSAYVTAEASPSPTTTSTVPSGASAVSGFGSNLLSFMAMPAFWGLFIFIGAIFWVSRSRGASGDLGIVAFILANLEAVIGLWSPFTWYILIVSWVIAGIYFTVGRKAVTQN